VSRHHAGHKPKEDSPIVVAVEIGNLRTPRMVTWNIPPGTWSRNGRAMGTTVCRGRSAEPRGIKMATVSCGFRRRV
jgi:hypothetical protein